MQVRIFRSSRAASWRAILTCLWICAASASAVPVLTFDENTIVPATNQDQTVGWQFDLSQTITVNGLAWYDDGQNGLAMSHTVGIWNPTGVLIASVLIPAGTAAPLDGRFGTPA